MGFKSISLSNRCTNTSKTEKDNRRGAVQHCPAASTLLALVLQPSELKKSNTVSCRVRAPCPAAWQLCPSKQSSTRLCRRQHSEQGLPRAALVENGEMERGESRAERNTARNICSVTVGTMQIFQHLNMFGITENANISLIFPEIALNHCCPNAVLPHSMGSFPQLDLHQLTA